MSRPCIRYWPGWKGFNADIFRQTKKPKSLSANGQQHILAARNYLMAERGDLGSLPCVDNGFYDVMQFSCELSVLPGHSLKATLSTFSRLFDSYYRAQPAKAKKLHSPSEGPHYFRNSTFQVAATNPSGNYFILAQIVACDYNS